MSNATSPQQAQYEATLRREDQRHRAGRAAARRSPRGSAAKPRHPLNRRCRELIGSPGFAHRRIVAVLVDQQPRGAEYVGVVDHSAAAIGSMQRRSLLAGLFTHVLTG